MLQAAGMQGREGKDLITSLVIIVTDEREYPVLKFHG